MFLRTHWLGQWPTSDSQRQVNRAPCLETFLIYGVKEELREMHLAICKYIMVGHSQPDVVIVIIIIIYPAFLTLKV